MAESSSTSPSSPVEHSDPGRALQNTVVRTYLLGSTGILLLGILLNYVLTDGRWYVSGGGKTGAQYLQADPYDIASGVILVISLVLLGVGFLWRRRNRHYARAAGFVVFGFYWATQAMKLYASEGGDFVNAIFAMFGVYFFNYFAYHEIVSYQRDEDPRALQWLAGTSFITTGVYFLTHKMEAIATWLILRVSEQTESLLHYFGQAVVRCGGDPDGSMIYYPTIPELGCNSGGYFPIQIILACTAIQSIMIFVGGIFALKPPRLGDGVSGKPKQFERLRPTYNRRRLWGFLLTVPLIYVLNLFRNVIIIWMSGQERAVYFSNHPGATQFVCNLSPQANCGPAEASFWFSHNVIGKGGSLVALIIIAFIVFQILPELYDSIIGLLDLKQRRGPLESWLFPDRKRPGSGKVKEPSEPRPAAPPAASPEPRLE